MWIVSNRQLNVSWIWQQRTGNQRRNVRRDCACVKINARIWRPEDENGFQLRVSHPLSTAPSVCLTGFLRRLFSSKDVSLGELQLIGDFASSFSRRPRDRSFSVAVWDASLCYLKFWTVETPAKNPKPVSCHSEASAVRHLLTLLSRHFSFSQISKV